jgi:transcriptional regulator with XRE-family HTH domain
MKRRVRKEQPSAAAKGSMKDFGSRLRGLRTERGLSQRELADLVGIEVMQVNRYERGVNVPSIETAVKLAGVFQLTTDELLGGSRERPEAPVLRNLKLYERLRLLDDLPKDDQAVVVRLIDAVIAQRRVQAAMTLPGKSR